MAGAIIGTINALGAYRMTYASIGDWRYNHIPLSRDTPFVGPNGIPGYGGFESAVVTRKAAWGAENHDYGTFEQRHINATHTIVSSDEHRV